MGEMRQGIGTQINADFLSFFCVLQRSSASYRALDKVDKVRYNAPA